MVRALETRAVTTQSELEVMGYELVGQKNRYLHRGGFSPYQLVFGVNPRLPGDILSDDPTDLVPFSDQSPEAMEVDSVAAEFTRRQQIRQEARRLLFASEAGRKLAAATRAARHQDRQFSKGQWVYVWRRASRTHAGNELGLQRDRWVGPGLVLLQ